MKPTLRDYRKPVVIKTKPKSTDVLYWHTYSRIRARYGIILTQELYQKFCSAIKRQKPDAKFLFKQSCSRSIWTINFAEQVIPVVYDRKRRCIVTVLPKNFLVDGVVKGKYSETFFDD